MTHIQAIVRIAAGRAKAEGVEARQKITAAVERGDIKTADMLEAQMVTAFKIEDAILRLLDDAEAPSASSVVAEDLPAKPSEQTP